MYFEALQIFCDVVRHQSFSRGASANAVSQSAASQAIRQLERRLGAQLIDRSKRPWQLTPEGRLFFEGCQEIVTRFQELEDAVRRQLAPSGYTVRAAAIYSVGLHDMSQYVDRFRASIPGAAVELEYMHPNQVYERVLSDQADLGLISFANPGRELTAIPWRREPMVVACLPSHRLAQRPASPKTGIDPAEVAGERFVAFDRGLTIRRETDRFLRRHDVGVDIVAEFDNIETIKQAVEEGAGIAVLPEPTLRREIESGTLLAVPFAETSAEEEFARPLGIIHRRKRPLNPAVTEFMKLLCQGDDAVAASSAAASRMGATGATGTPAPRQRSRPTNQRSAARSPRGDSNSGVSKGDEQYG